MEKKLILFITVVCSLPVFSQVGVNTQYPSATLDIVSKGNTNTTKALEVNNSSQIEVFTILDNGNVGVGISNPSAQLHTTGTVKMENRGTNVINTKVMTTDATGNVTTRATPTLLPAAIIGGNAADAVSNVQNITSINNVPGYTSGLLTKNFTLTRTSLVTFSYSLGVYTVRQNAAGSPPPFITDGAAKQVGAQLIWKGLPAGSPFVVDGVISISAMPYSSSASGNIVTGTFYPSSTSSLILTPGDYSVELQGFINAADNGQGVSAIIGGNAYDRFDVIAIAVQ
jgi:hypothetical protein